MSKPTTLSLVPARARSLGAGAAQPHAAPPRLRGQTTIYKSLAAEIRRSITDGKLLPGAFIGSEHELARRQAISRVTVRRASELLMTEGLIERRPGKGLVVHSPAAPMAPVGGTIQVVLGNLSWEAQIRMARGVQQSAEADKSIVQLYDAHGEIEQDLQLIADLPRRGAQGAVIVSLHSPAFMRAICQLQQEQFPFVLLDHRLRDLAVSAVVADNYSGGYQVGQMLAGHGHRSVAFLGNLSASTVQDRLDGLRDGLSDAGVPLRTSMVADLPLFTPFGESSAAVAKAVSELLARTPRPTALYCSCDAIAAHAYRHLSTMGLRIPQDLSVVGNDDDPALQWLSPGLTTVRQSFQEMGQAAMDLLRRRIAHPTAPAEVRVHPVTLVQRDSVSQVAG
jgi:DNA-binding LacI/PurR family transcriptional regulator